MVVWIKSLVIFKQRTRRENSRRGLPRLLSSPYSHPRQVPTNPRRTPIFQGESPDLNIPVVRLLSHYREGFGFDVEQETSWLDLRTFPERARGRTEKSVNAVMSLFRHSLDLWHGYTPTLIIY